jgi:hypothetical protein
VRNFTNTEKAVLQAPVDVAIRGWLIVAGVTAALGLGIWYTESKLSQHQGTGALTPSSEPVRVAHGPSFGAAGQTSIAAGPLRVGGGVSGAGEGSGPTIVYSESGGGVSQRLAERGSGPKEHRGAQQARRAGEKASIAGSKLSEARSNAAIKKGFA